MEPQFPAVCFHPVHNCRLVFPEVSDSSLAHTLFLPGRHPSGRIPHRNLSGILHSLDMCHGFQLMYVQVQHPHVLPVLTVCNRQPGLCRNHFVELQLPAVCFHPVHNCRLVFPEVSDSSLAHTLFLPGRHPSGRIPHRNLSGILHSLDMCHGFQLMYVQVQHPHVLPVLTVCNRQPGLCRNHFVELQLPTVCFHPVHNCRLAFPEVSGKCLVHTLLLPGQYSSGRIPHRNLL